MAVRAHSLEKATTQVITQTLVQLLFTTSKSFTVDALREKLRDFYKNDANAHVRASASITNVELIGILIDANKSLALAGLQFQIINGVVALITTKVHPKLSDYLTASGTPPLSELTAAMLEVLACVALKGPICQARINALFDADKRFLVAQLVERNLIEAHTGEGGRFHFVTTAGFLRRFGLESLEHFRAVAFPNR